MRLVNSGVRENSGDGKGINLLISQGHDANDPIDPVTGHRIPKSDIEKFQVKFDPPLRDVTLRQLLDSIVKVAKPPLSGTGALNYSVENYAVVFNDNPPAQFYTRTYSVDFQNTIEKLYPVAERRTNADGTISAIHAPLKTNQIQTILRDYFISVGVEFPVRSLDPQPAAPPRPATKAMFYNDRAGILFVRAPLQDLDHVENAIHALNAQPPQISFEVQIAQIPPDLDIKFDFPKPIRQVGSTNEYLTPVRTNPVGNDPHLRATAEVVKKLDVPVQTTIQSVQAEVYFIPTAQKKFLIDALINREHVDLMTLPTVTTLLGRQALISVQDTKTVITEKTIVQNGTIISNPAQLQLGSEVWIDPTLVTGKGVTSTATFNLVEFLDYVPNTETPLPRLRIRSTQTLTEIPHNHTQVIILPRHPQDPRRILYLFTPTVIDSAGNRVFK